MSGGGKGGKGGGSSGSIDVTSTSTSSNIIDSTTDATITSTSTTDLTSTSTNQIDSKATAQLQILGLDDVKVKADTTSDNKTQLEMDLKPLQVDFCFKVGIERLPSTRVCKPMSRHFGLSLFGVEVVGFNYSSEEKTIIEDMRNRPFIVPEAYSSSGAGHGHEHHPSGVQIHLNE